MNLNQKGAFVLALIATFDLPWITIQATLVFCWYMYHIWKKKNCWSKKLNLKQRIGISLICLQG